MTSKTARYILAALAGAALLPGCTRTEPETLGAAALTARIAEEDPSTRTSYDSYEGKFLWNEGDEIAVHLADGTASGRYETFRVHPNNPAKTGTVAISTTSAMTRDFYAVYPAVAAVADAYGSPTLKVSLPASYDISDIVAGSGTADFSPCPMVAVNNPASTPDELDFYHVGGLLRITLRGVKPTTKSVRVTFDEYATGTFAVATPSAVPSASVEGPKITEPDETGRGKVVTFTLTSGTSLGETLAAGTIVLNVPVPCVTFNSVTVETLNESGTAEATRIFDDKPLIFNRHHGKKLAFGELIYDFVLEHTGTVVELWDGVTGQTLVRSDETAGPTDAALFESYMTLDNGLTKEAVELVYEYALADADGNPVRDAQGNIIWSSTVPDMLSNDVVVTGVIDNSLVANVAENTDPTVKTFTSPLLTHAQNLQSKGTNGFSASAPQDLSLYDVTDLAAPRSSGKPVTANCYIVDRAGWYMFPIVYGNAIDYHQVESTSIADPVVNGVNMLAYRSVTGNTPPYSWTEPNDFFRYDGASIRSPYILDDVELGVDQVEAVVVWEDVESATYSFIEDVEVVTTGSSNLFYDPVSESWKTEMPYIKFRIPEGQVSADEQLPPTRRITGIRPGNALVALRRASDQTILWSWHIWVTDGYDSDEDGDGDGLAPIPVLSNLPIYSPTTYNVFPLPLGWTDEESATTFDDRISFVRVRLQGGGADPIFFQIIQHTNPSVVLNSGTYYQWGRKDPFFPTVRSATAAGNKPHYSPSGYTETDLTGDSGTGLANSREAVTKDKIIRYPYVAYMSADGDQWCLPSAGITGQIRQYPWLFTSVPSIYSPCPPGTAPTFRGSLIFTQGNQIVSAPNINAVGAFAHGWRFNTGFGDNTFFIPASGYRRLASGGGGILYAFDAGWYTSHDISTPGFYFSETKVWLMQEFDTGLNCYNVIPQFMSRKDL